MQAAKKRSEEDVRFLPHEEKGAAMFHDAVPAEILEDLREHVREHGTPDTYLWHSHTKPKYDEVPEIVAVGIEVPHRLRSTVGRAPCPLCSLSAPKYFNGVVAHFRKEGVIRCIGVECGRHFWGADFDKAKDNYERQRDEDDALNFLIENMNAFTKLREILEEVRPKIRDLDRLRFRFLDGLTRAKAKSIYKLMVGNVLEVFEEREIIAVDRNGRPSTRKVSVVVDRIVFKGKEALRSYEAAEALIQQALVRLKYTGCFSDDAILQLSPSEHVRATQLLREARAQASRAFEICENTKVLLIEDNLLALGDWFRHPNCSVESRIVKERFGRVLVGIGNRSVVIITVQPSLLEELPLLPSFV